MTAKVPDVGVIRDAVMLACRAPSLHNSQPWRWIAEGGTLQLWADNCRAMTATDHTGRELTLSCGAVLDHLRVAMAAAGWNCVTERFPEADNPNHLATVLFRPTDAVSKAEQLRADAIRRRRTDRLPFDAPLRWPALQSNLLEAVITHDVLLDVVDDDARLNLAEASRLTEALRRYDSTYQSELRWWTSPFDSDDTHVPEGAMVSTTEAERLDVARAFPPAGGGRRRATIDHDRSKILVLSSYNDDPWTVLQCGEALSAVLLECTVAGMATCTLTHMTETAASRNIVAQIIGTAGRPQLLIRVGRSPAHEQRVQPTPRRPLIEVLEVRGYLPKGGGNR